MNENERANDRDYPLAEQPMIAELEKPTGKTEQVQP